MEGWSGAILRVDLDQAVTSQERLAEDELRQYIGGRGLAVRLLTQEVEATVDALAAPNKMIFAAGPLTGTATPGNGRCVVASKSPVNQGLACANLGGYWAAELKLAGYDALVVEGKAAEPVYLFVGDDGVELRPAHHLWGNGTKQTTRQVRADTEEDAAVICIGPAGERAVLISSIVDANRRWSSGRAGLGAVMGSKNLKAIAVKGKRPLRIADRQRFLMELQAFRSRLANEPLLSYHLPFYGTASLVWPLHSAGALPSHNFSGVPLPGAAGLRGEALGDSLLHRRVSCFACPVACGRATGVSGCTGEGPELEDILALGSNCGIGDLQDVARATYLCEDLGLDPVAAGSAIACAMDMHAKGVAGPQWAGRHMPFGDAACLLESLELIAYRRGAGEVMAEGAFHLAQRYDVPELFTGVKKQALHAYDPRPDEWLALSYATANTGAVPMTNGRLIQSLLIHPTGKAPSEETTAQRIKAQQGADVVMESVGICPLVALVIDVSEAASLLAAATGQEMAAVDLLAAGARIWDLERGFNLRAGFSAADDRLAERFFAPISGKLYPAFTLADLVQEYYRLRGWDASGHPAASAAP
ncbi:MAG: aldehyde ferredoxin oxidoreductase family protein [Chloroflexi bacterium]|nr:aldehyde ferredoxin oxidoreductase family protein [Chloroflexota bacterium]